MCWRRKKKYSEDERIVIINSAIAAARHGEALILPNDLPPRIEQEIFQHYTEIRNEIRREMIKQRRLRRHKHEI
jgi:hypothetical protein